MGVVDQRAYQKLAERRAHKNLPGQPSSEDAGVHFGKTQSGSTKSVTTQRKTYVRQGVPPKGRLHGELLLPANKPGCMRGSGGGLGGVGSRASSKRGLYLGCIWLS